MMEMCLDNPRSGFADLFATHPSIDGRIKALIKFAGSHDLARSICRPPVKPSEQDEAQAAEKSKR